MKKIAGLIVILVAFVLGGYYAMGLATERTMKSNIALVNTSAEVHVDIKDYKRGWFRSQANLHWVLHMPAQEISLTNNQSKKIPARDLTFDMPLVISHGPIIFANRTVQFGLGYAHTDLPLPQEFLTEFDKLFAAESTKPKPELSVFINYLNHSKMNFVLPEFTLIDKKEKDQRVEWKGMEVSAGLSGKKLDGDIVITGFTVTDSKMNALIGKITMSYNLAKAPNNLYLGDVSFAIPSISVKEADKTYFNLDNYTFYNKVDMKDNLLDYVLNMSLDKTVVLDKAYGPAHLDLMIKNIDADAAAKLNDLAVQLQNAADADKQKISFAMLAQVPVLFSKGAQFEIARFDAKMPEGLVEGKALVSLPKDPGMNPFAIMQKIKGNAELKIPVAVLKTLLIQMNRSNNQAAQAAQGANATTAQQQAPDQLAEEQVKSMLQSGLIVQHDTDFMVQLSFENGQLMVNAKPFNPAMMKF